MIVMPSHSATLTCTPRHLRPGQVCARCKCRSGGRCQGIAFPTEQKSAIVTVKGIIPQTSRGTMLKIEIMYSAV